MALATALMAVAVIVAVVTLVEGASLDPDRSLDALLILIVGGSVGAIAYLVTTHLFGLDEPAIMLRRLTAMRGRRGRGHG
jgi:hypothetical protein